MTVSPWRKSTRCSANNGCVELARLNADLVGVRDSKNRDGSRFLIFGRETFATFVAFVKAVY